MESIREPPVVKGNWKRCALLFGFFGCLIVALYWWFFPLLREFAPQSHCTDVFGINGSIFLFGGIFIGIPLSTFLFTAWLAFYSRRILIEEQFPTSGTWVCRDTVAETGWKAKLRGYIGLSTPLFGLAFLIWGVVAFQDLKYEMIYPGIEKHSSSCDMRDNKSLKYVPALSDHPRTRQSCAA